MSSPAAASSVPEAKTEQKAEKVDVSKIKIAFVPGTGNMGLKLARNHAKHSEVIIGSREQKKAEAAAEAIRKVLGEKTRIKGMTNEAAAASADVVFFCAQGSLDDRAAVLKSLADSLKNKIVVDITNIAYISSFFTEKVWGQTCSTEQCMAAIPDVPIKWCCAYKTNFASSLDKSKDKDGIPIDVFVAGDDDLARRTVIELINLTGYRGVDCGGAKNMRIIELMGPPWIMTLDKNNLSGPRTGGWRYR